MISRAQVKDTPDKPRIGKLKYTKLKIKMLILEKRQELILCSQLFTMQLDLHAEVKNVQANLFDG